MGLSAHATATANGMVHTLLTTNRFSVERRKVSTPEGTQLHRDVIIHPRAVVILPLIDPKTVVMIRNWRFTVQETLLELPAGTLEADEDPRKAAARELREETGYECGALEPLVDFYSSPGIMTEKLHAFTAHNLTHVGQQLDEIESISVEIMSLDKIRQKITHGEVNDGKTLAVLGMYLLREG